MRLHIKSMQSAPFRSSPISAAYFLSRGGASVHIEGQAFERHVVVRFPDLETAQACYDSAAYQAALQFAKDASIRSLVIVEETE